MDLEDYNYYIHTGLKIRLVIYFFLLSVMLSFVVFDLFQDHTGIIFPLISLLIGCGIGGFFSRIHKITWDKNAEQIIARIDISGAIILILYIVFELYRQQIVGEFIHGPTVATTSLALLAGAMFGRVFWIRKKVHVLLEENM